MSLTANSTLHHVRGEQSEYPQSAAAIYEGKLLGDSAGYARQLVAGDRFIGHSQEYYDNSAGSAGDHNITRLRGRYRLQVTLSGVAVTDVGETVFASDAETLTLTPGGNSPVGRVDRYVTTDTAIVEFDTGMWDPVAIAARGRTAVQLPSLAILKNFNLAKLLANPMAGSCLFTDFTNGGLPDVRFIDATYAATAGGKTPTEQLSLGITAIGELLSFCTTDNQTVEGQWACPIVVSGGNPWAFGVRIKQSILTDSKAGWFAGLMLGQPLVGNLIADGGTLQADGSIGFQVKEGDGDKIDLVYDETGQAQNEHDDDYVTQVADTYNVLELYCDGETIQGYVDGVATGTAISAVDIAAADFPTAKIFQPTFALKGAAADDFTVTKDWMYAIQEG